MSYEPYDPRDSSDPRGAGAGPTPDAWTSPLWASPDTVAGHWVDPDVDGAPDLPEADVPEADLPEDAEAQGQDA